MPKAKQKEIVVNVTKALRTETAALLEVYATKQNDAEIALLNLANGMYADGIQKFHFVRDTDKDTPEYKQFNPILEAEINEALARAMRGAEGVDWVKMPKELLQLVTDPDKRSQIVAFQKKVTSVRTKIGNALQDVYDGMSEVKKKGRASAMLASELFDAELSELANKLAKLSRSRQDVSPLDLGIIIRDARKAGRALKAPPAKQ